MPIWTIFFLTQAESICHSLSVLVCGFSNQLTALQGCPLCANRSVGASLGTTHLHISRDLKDFYPCTLERSSGQRGRLSGNKSSQAPLNPALYGYHCLPESWPFGEGCFRHLLWIVAHKAADSRPAPQMFHQLDNPESPRPEHWHMSCWPDGLRTKLFPALYFSILF